MGLASSSFTWFAVIPFSELELGKVVSVADSVLLIPHSLHGHKGFAA
jgi:hypothetical protein